MADKFRKLLAARRQFSVMPARKSELPLPEGADGAYFPDEKIAIYDDGVRPWDPSGPPARGRGVRRHEVMHGIRDMAMQDPALREALPWWARRGKTGGFEDELLARLAGGDVMDWPMSQYFMDDPLKYGAAMPVYAAARNPEAILAGAVGGGSILGYALAQEPKETEANKFDKLIGRLGGRHATAEGSR